jgi:uncharacterized protein with HEPN domain
LSVDPPAADPLARLRFLVDVVELEARHLALTDGRLFVEPMTVERAGSLRGLVQLAEQVDAFVARLGRLQDTLADKLLPTLLEHEGETLGTVLDNLVRAEKLGWVRSVDDWLTIRKLRNRMIHEYVRDVEVLAAALSAAHLAVPMLLEAASTLATHAHRRLGVAGA